MKFQNLIIYKLNPLYKVLKEIEKELRFNISEINKESLLYSGNNDLKNKIWAVPGLEKYHGQDIFLTEALSLEILENLKEPIESKSPFFLYFSLYFIFCLYLFYLQSKIFLISFFLS